MAHAARLGLATLALWTAGVGAACIPNESSPPPHTSTTTTSSFATPVTPSSPQPSAAPSPTGLPTPQDSPSPPPTYDAKVSDPQITAALEAANIRDLDQARIAAKRAVDPRVAAFAHEMLAGLERGETKLRGLEAQQRSTPQEGPTSDQVKLAGESALLALRTATSSAFDRTYIDAQVDEQQRVLTLLDRLLPEAQGPALKEVLTEYRARVADRLRAATDIQGSMPR
jgi:putative membrane protein